MIFTADEVDSDFPRNFSNLRSSLKSFPEIGTALYSSGKRLKGFSGSFGRRDGEAKLR